MDQIELSLEDESFISLRCTVPDKSNSLIELQCTAPDKPSTFINLQCTATELPKTHLSSASPDNSTSAVDATNSSKPQLSCSVPDPTEPLGIARSAQSSFHNTNEMIDIEDAVANNILTGELANPDDYIPNVQIISHYTNSIESIYENKSKNSSLPINNKSDDAPSFNSIPLDDQFDGLSDSNIEKSIQSTPNDDSFDVMKIAAVQPRTSHAFKVSDPYSFLDPPSQIPKEKPVQVHSFDLFSTPSPQFTSKLMIPNRASQASHEITCNDQLTTAASNTSVMPMDTRNDTLMGDAQSNSSSVIESSVIEDYQFPLIPAPLKIDYDNFDANLNTILFMNYQFLLLNDSYLDSIKHRGGLITSIYEIRMELQPVIINDAPNEDMTWLLGLAMDIPRIACFWIDDCIEQNQILPFHGYMLCNGYINKSPIFATIQPNLFGNQTFVIGEHQEYAYLIEQCGGIISLEGTPVNPQLVIASLIQQINLFLY
eukprot:NODE_219_length_14015_cov_0.496335.p2 type:complete len:485 gc:universal NODE_219_length_14015_cov_0.496335:1046-2500(+)